MGEPAQPTAKDRAGTRALAAAVIRAVTEDESIAEALGFSRHLARYEAENIEPLIMDLAQEIDTLRCELGEAIDLAEEANGDPSSCSYNVPIGDRLKELRRSRGVR